MPAIRNHRKCRCETRGWDWTVVVPRGKTLQFRAVSGVKKTMFERTFPVLPAANGDNSCIAKYNADQAKATRIAIICGTIAGVLILLAFLIKVFSMYRGHRRKKRIAEEYGPLGQAGFRSETTLAPGKVDSDSASTAPTVVSASPPALKDPEVGGWTGMDNNSAQTLSSDRPARE